MRHNHTLNQRNKAMKLCYRAWEQVKNKIEVVIQGAFIIRTGFWDACFAVLLECAEFLIVVVSTWRFMGSYKRGYKSPFMGYNYSYPTCNPTYNYP